MQDALAPEQSHRTPVSTRKACDQCNFRKVKCRPPEVGLYPCLSCTRNDLDCRQEKAEKRRGPRSTRIQALQIQQASGPLATQSESPRYDSSMSPLATSAGPTPGCSRTRVGDTAPQALDYVDSTNSSDEWLQQMLEPNLPEDVFDGFPGSNVVTSDFRTLPFVDWARASALDFACGPIAPDAQNMVWQPQDDFSHTSDTILAVNQSLDIYFRSFYPMFPILNQDRVRSAVPNYLSRASDPSLSNVKPTNKMLDSILALIECRDHGTNRELTPHFTQITGQKLELSELDTPSVDSVMCRLHIFVCYQSLGQRLAAWYHLQEAMTLMLMLGQPGWAEDVREEHLRLYWVLFIAERAYVALQQLPPRVERPLRLADDTYLTSTPDGPSLSGLPDFPMSHLRLFALIKAEQVACWRGTCGGSRGCKAWSMEQALFTMSSFREEMTSAKDLWNRQVGLAVQSVNLVITIAWFRDRFWNVFLRHGLIGSSNHDTLGFPVIEENLHEVTDFCVRINTTDFDKGVDCNAKLSDLAMTALALIKLFKQNMAGLENSVDGYSDWPSLAARLLASVYKVLGLLNMLATEGDTFCKDIRHAIADATSREG